MERLIENSEDIELEDEEETNPAVVVDKYFNFDMLSSTEPNITRIKPPDFNDLVPAPVNPKFDRQYVDRAYYKKSNPAESVLLPHKYQYYYCGCIGYDRPIATIDRPFNTCTLAPIAQGEQVFIITLFLNKRMGHTTSQRWRKDCWERLQPELQHSWLEYKYHKEQEEAKKYFDLHSIVNKDGERVVEPAKTRGRPKAAELLALSDIESETRLKLIRRYASYQGRRRQLAQTNKDTSAVENLLNAIMDQVSNLGGTPDGWIRYGNNTTTEPDSIKT